MKKIFLSLSTILILTLGLGGAAYGLAENPACSSPDPLGSVTIHCPSNNDAVVQSGSDDNEDAVGNAVSSAMNVLMWVVGVISVVMMVLGGIMYAMAAGDEAKTKKAKRIIVGAIIGLAVVVLSFVVATLVSNVATNSLP